jgi:SAM-dependent methyltransferase
MNLDQCVWRSESDTPAPTLYHDVDDSLTADEALRRVRRGEYLCYSGHFLNAKQLLSAMGRRLLAPKAKGSILVPPAGVTHLNWQSQIRHCDLTPPHGFARLNRQSRILHSPLDAFRAERRARALEHETLGKILVQLDSRYALQLQRGPEVALACLQVWGPAPAKNTLVSLKTLLGMLGAAQWRKTGLTVPGLPEKLTPHYGVYLPTRTDYVELLRRLDGVSGAECFDVGTGTGVLGLVLLQKGAARVIGTDVEPRAVACALENAQNFSVSERFEILERPLFPEGKADIIVCNPPWVPEAPKNRVDGAIFDPEHQMLNAFLQGLARHLRPGGRGVLLMSNLAELLTLRAPGYVETVCAANGLVIAQQFSNKANHGRAKDQADPLHEVRRREVTTLLVLQASA